VKDGKGVHVAFFDSARGRFGPESVTSSHNRPFATDHWVGGAWSPPEQRSVVSDAAALQDARQRLQREYELYDAEAAAQWMHPANGPRLQRDASGGFGRDIPAGAYPLSAGEDGRCTINGQDGRLVRKGDWLVCEPVRQDAMPVADARAEAYRRYDEEMANAWRNLR
jgi:hypothetical protein